MQPPRSPDAGGSDRSGAETIASASSPPRHIWRASNPGRLATLRTGLSCSSGGAPTSRRPARRTRMLRRSRPTTCAQRSPQRQRNEPERRSRRQRSESRGSGIQLAGRMTAEPRLLHSVANGHCPGVPGHHKGQMSRPGSPRNGNPWWTHRLALRFDRGPLIGPRPSPGRHRSTSQNRIAISEADG